MLHTEQPKRRKSKMESLVEDFRVLATLNGMTLEKQLAEALRSFREMTEDEIGKQRVAHAFKAARRATK